MIFTYKIENNGVHVELVCRCGSEDTGSEAAATPPYLISAMLGEWDLSGLMTETEIEDIERFCLENIYEIEQRLTNQSMRMIK